MIRIEKPASWGRVLVVVAHRDDETIGFGGHLACIKPAVCHLTNSLEPNSPFGDAAEAVRAREWSRVRVLAQLPADQMFACEYPDGCLCFHTRDAIEKVSAAIERTRADTVLTHTYEGGHPDHDAAAFICAQACRDLRRPINLIEYPSYHLSSAGNSSDRWVFGSFLPSSEKRCTVLLSPRARQAKRTFLEQYRSQLEFLRRFTTVERLECFRAAPDHDFSRPPHSGPLLYETFGNGLTAQAWRAAVHES